jgi:hypothetical protein
MPQAEATSLDRFKNSGADSRPRSFAHTSAVDRRIANRRGHCHLVITSSVFNYPASIPYSFQPL